MKPGSPAPGVNPEPSTSPLRHRAYEIIFEAETPAGRWFDIILLWAILASVLTVMLDSVESLRIPYGPLFLRIEWGLTILFTIEYVVRLWCVRNPMQYAKSFYGIIDLLAILPTYLSIFSAGMQALLVLRSLRLLRVFRILKLARYIGEATVLTAAIAASRRKITVFLGFILTLDLIIGSLMYLIEGKASGFDSIPRSMYWAIVTMTTVGYGDISPATWQGQTLAAIVMIMGYAIIAVPTGIVSVELAAAQKQQITTETCPACLRDGHDHDANHCKYCGSHLHQV